MLDVLERVTVVTQFIAEAATECPPELRPDWMVAHHRLSIPDVIRSTVDPAIRQRWQEDAAAARPDRYRESTWRLSLHEADGTERTGRNAVMTPDCAWTWFRAMRDIRSIIPGISDLRIVLRRLP